LTIDRWLIVLVAVTTVNRFEPKLKKVKLLHCACPFLYPFEVVLPQSLCMSVFVLLQERTARRSVPATFVGVVNPRS
jgi:hypothetical protein